MKKLTSLAEFIVFLIAFTYLSASAQSLSNKTLDNLTLSTDSVGPVRFVAVHGRRSALMGYSANGLEIWAWPFQILDGYHISFRPEGVATEIPGSVVLRRIEYRPESVTRIYSGPDFIVREKLFVPLDKPGAILSFKVQGRGHVDIDVQFTPQMNLMWPAAVGGQSFQWNSSISGYVLTDPADGYTAAVSSPDVVAHDSTVNSAIHYSQALSMILHPKSRSVDTAVAELFVAMNPVHDKDVTEAIKDLSANQNTYEQQAADHYAKLESTSLQIRTPDEDVNRALAWSEIALDQAWVCNPQLGCGIVAGYGPSRSGRRPQYAWFFAGDGLIATDGLVASGEYARARAELEFILKYQNHKTGMIWHEISQSAGFLDWENKYPYMLVHVDITFQFLSAVAQYIETSGDVDFARQNWAALDLAYKYCQSIVDTGTRLPRIPSDKEGSNEQDRESDELSLSAAWLDASASFSQLANWTSHPDLASEAGRASEAARQSIAKRYWDANRQFWISGHTVTGAEVFDERSGTGGLISKQVFSPEQNSILLNKLAGSGFQTDWGSRGLSSNSPDYDPNSYSKGSVFALGATGAAETFWAAHRPATAFPIWNAVAAWTQLDSLGHIHEVTDGDFYRQQTESVAEQTWSSAGLLAAAARGLLGIHVDSVSNKLVFAPHTPPEWQTLSAENVRVGKSIVGLNLSMRDDGIDLAVANQGDAVAVTFDPEIPLGAGGITAECANRRVTTAPQVNAQDEHAQIQLTAPGGSTQCSIHYRGGVTVIPPRTVSRVGDESSGLKITGMNLAGRVLTVDADVNSAGPQFVEIDTPWTPLSAKGGKITPETANLYRIDFDRPSPSDQHKYAHDSVTIQFREK